MTGFSADTIRFLENLHANNNRAWFEENRSIYETSVRDAARSFARDLAHLLERETGRTHNHKIFRISRDLRFSKDKTPYNTHIHLAFWPVGGMAALMLGLEPGKLTFGAGTMSFAKKTLVVWRNRVAAPEGARLTAILQDLTDQGCRIPEAELRRLPPGYDKDHPRAALLRRKSLTVWRDTSQTDFCFGADGPARCMQELQDFQPLLNWMNANLGSDDA